MRESQSEKDEREAPRVASIRMKARSQRGREVTAGSRERERESYRTSERSAAIWGDAMRGRK